MAAMNSMHTVSRKPALASSGRRRIVQVFAQLVVIGGILFLSAGRLDWVAGWVYMGLYLLSILSNGIVGLRLNPDLINERGKVGENVKGWDRVLTRLMIPFGLAIYVLAGLDGGRWQWSVVPAWFQVAAVVALIFAFAVITWLFAVNTYAATVVRIQTHRGQKVITTGPYRFVRHPMYAAVILSNLCTPLLLGSWWALIPGVISALLFVVRTWLEDRTLRHELPGYEGYAEHVRHRLVPGIW